MNQPPESQTMSQRAEPHQSLIHSIFSHDPKTIVYVDQYGLKTLGNLESTVAGLVEQLDHYDQQNWVLHESNPYLFLVALLALIIKGRNVYIVSRGQLENVPDVVSGEYCFIGSSFTPQTPVDVSTSGSWLWDETESIINSHSPPFSELPLADFFSSGFVCFLTSGSTGKPKPVQKNITQLTDEIALFATQWQLRNDSVYFCLVSHQHIYGLGFGYLLPLYLGSPFYGYTNSGILRATEAIELHAITKSSPIKKAVVIASPTAGRMAERIIELKEEHSIVDDSQVIPVSRVFCAGGKLGIGECHQMHSLFGSSLTEILGSTETGAVAFREHHPINTDFDDWKLLPGIKLLGAKTNIGNRIPLKAWGAHVSGLHGEPLSTGDEILVTAINQFQLCGRLDRIKKIEGKRISLDHVSNVLDQHPFVDQCYITPLETSQREYLGGCIVLSAPGLECYRSKGKFELDSELRTHLSDIFDPVTLPRYFRYVDHIAQNSQGKITAQSAEAMFTNEYPRYPIIISKYILDGERMDTRSNAALEMKIPADLLYLRGHFSGLPVVPGLILLQWAHYYCTVVLGVKTDPAKVSRLKFSKIIQPGDIVKLGLSFTDASISFNYSQGDGVVMASGVLYHSSYRGDTGFGND